MTAKTLEEQAKARAQWKAQREFEKTWEVPPDFDFGYFVAWSTFVFAKTMADRPHEYTVRGKTAYDSGDGLEFVYAVLTTRRDGYRHDYGFGRGLYYDHDGWHYWTMGATINTPSGKPWTIILNRAEGTRPQQELGL